MQKIWNATSGSIRTIGHSDKFAAGCLGAAENTWKLETLFRSITSPKQLAFLPASPKPRARISTLEYGKHHLNGEFLVCSTHSGLMSAEGFSTDPYHCSRTVIDHNSQLALISYCKHFHMNKLRCRPRWIEGERITSPRSDDVNDVMRCFQRLVWNGGAECLGQSLIVGTLSLPCTHQCMPSSSRQGSFHFGNTTTKPLDADHVAPAQSHALL